MELKPNDYWLTPHSLLDVVKGYKNYGVAYGDIMADMATTPDNPAKFPFFYTQDHEGGSLTKEWPSLCFVNWPFSQTRKWVEKAADAYAKGSWVVGLGPASVMANKSTRHLVESCQVIILGRVKFEPPNSLKEHRESEGLKGNPTSPSQDVAFYLWGFTERYADYLSRELGGLKVWR